jgi:anti-anti-sigma factor
MDSTGPRLLLSLDQEARRSGVRFTVVRGSDLVHGPIEVTGLGQVLEIVADPEQAGRPP